jgi:hypothetical protein
LRKSYFVVYCGGIVGGDISQSDTSCRATTSGSCSMICWAIATARTRKSTRSRWAKIAAAFWTSLIGSFSPNRGRRFAPRYTL